ncbi:MAG: OmpA/MotB domain protein [Bacteroidetes bacterium]|nr:OmpA/MotB domain protein [Bacteroidota bacterium]
MKKIYLVLICLAAFCAVRAQVTIIGHNQINNSKLNNTKIIVKDGNDILQKLDTKNSPDFRIKLDFGKIYRLYFQNEQCPVMCMEVVANNIPVDKRAYNMVYELNVPFYYKNDEDVDTTVFAKPFHKVIFNGATKMVDDTTYNNAFARKIIKPFVNPYDQVKAAEGKQVEVPVTIAGRACLNGDYKLSITNKVITILDKKGQVMKSTRTNRSGAFAFTGIKASEVGKIKIESKENDLNNGQITLLNSENKKVTAGKYGNGGCELPLKDEGVKALTDNAYTYNIGGKLILNSPGKKKFLANKTVYLANKRNTLIKKTTTNVLGTFVFEDIKPDNTYYIGVDSKEAGSGEKIDFLNKDDKFVANLDTVAAARKSLKITSDYNKTFNDISISEDEMRMNVKAKLYGDNTNNPIGKLKILLLNDDYQVIDSALTDDFGSFRFKYLPFLKRFYLSAENTNNILDVFNNILVYSSEDNMIKIMTHEKGAKFKYKPLSGEMSKLKDIEIDDPWLDLVSGEPKVNKRSLGTAKKTIVENILFEFNKHDLLPQAQEILDKVILVMNTNKNIKVELSAHTDSKGNDADNLKLSQLRAKTAREYISKAGIEESRIISVGYGESKLLNKCGNNVNCSEVEHAQNRRVEFKILEE